MAENVSDIEKIEALQKSYSTLFNTKDGQLVLQDLKKRYCIDKTTMDVNPHYTSCNEGMRTVVLHIQNQMKMTIKKREELQNARESG